MGQEQSYLNPKGPAQGGLLISRQVEDKFRKFYQSDVKIYQIYGKIVFGNSKLNDRSLCQVEVLEAVCGCEAKNRYHIRFLDSDTARDC